MLKAHQLKRIGKFALFLGIAFCIGSLVSSLLSSFARDVVSQQTESLQRIVTFMVQILLSTARGALVGLALGLALREEQRRITALTLWGSIGFLFGGVFVQLPKVIPGLVFGQYFWGIPLLEGAFIGAALGFAFRDQRRKRIIILVVAWVVGYWVSLFILVGSTMILDASFEGDGQIPSAWFGGVGQFVVLNTIRGIISGTLLGAAFGYITRPSPEA